MSYVGQAGSLRPIFNRPGRQYVEVRGVQQPFPEAPVRRVRLLRHVGRRAASPPQVENLPHKHSIRPCFVLLLLSPAIFAQPAPPAFATAEVRASAPGTRESGGFLPEGHFECRGVTMLKLVATAYGVNNSLVVGGPDWLTSDRFDISARAPAHDASRADMRQMLAALLADRFGLAVHQDKREMPVYLLTVAKGGPHLQEASNSSASDCPVADGDPDLNHRACRSYTMAELGILLPQIANNYVDRPVVDNTGLSGGYDFSLDWMDKSDYLADKAVGRPAVSIFDALERLGLALSPGTGPARVIVVDRINRTPVAASSPALPSEFEAAEIRRSDSVTRNISARPDGEVDITGYTLRQLIRMAFEVGADRVFGGPKWVDEHFDVIAKSPDAMSPRAVNAMLKTLLVERFKLETHTESRPANAFALVVGKSSPELQPSAGAERSECKLSVAEKGRAFVCRNTTMAQFAQRLPDVAQAYLVFPMVDQTGLSGAYDFSLTWTPRNRLPAGRRPSPGTEAAAPQGDVTVFEAVEQLGLRLEERKQSVPVIVIDRVELHI